MALDRLIKAALAGIIAFAGTCLESGCNDASKSPKAPAPRRIQSAPRSIPSGSPSIDYRITVPPSNRANTSLNDRIVSAWQSDVELEYRQCLARMSKMNTIDPNNFSGLVEKAPDNARAHMIMGNVLSFSRVSERHLKAIEEFSRAIQLDPKAASAYVNRGIMVYELVEPIKEMPEWMATKENMPERFVRTSELAIRDFDTAIKINPRLFSAYFDKGVVLKYLGREEEAISVLEKAIKIGIRNRNTSPTVSNEGDAEVLGTGDPMMVVSSFKNYAISTKATIQKKGRRVVNLTPYVTYIPNEDDPIALAYYHMGTAYASSHLRNYTAAIDCFDKAIRLNENMPFLYSSRFTIYKGLGAGYENKQAEDVRLYNEVLRKINEIKEAKR